MEISSGSWQTGYEASPLIQVRDEATLKTIGSQKEPQTWVDQHYLNDLPLFLSLNPLMSMRSL